MLESDWIYLDPHPEWFKFNKFAGTEFKMILQVIVSKKYSSMDLVSSCLHEIAHKENRKTIRILNTYA